MERPDVIKKFLSLGYQLSGGALDQLLKNQDKVDTVLKKLEEHPRKTVITEELIKTLLKDFRVETKLTPEDYANFFSQRFDFIKKIFSQRGDVSNLISINKIYQRTKRFSVLGIVKDVVKEDGVIVLEDKTGEVEIKTRKKNTLDEIVLDEILVVLCDNSHGMVEGNEILFPDTPMKREINRAKNETYCLFISDIHMDSEKFNKKYYENFIEWLVVEEKKINIFVVGDVSRKTEHVNKFLSDIPKKHQIKMIPGEIDPEMEDFLSNPATLELEGVNLFLFHNANLSHYVNLWESPEKSMTNLIKKRHLDPTFRSNVSLDSNDPYLIKKIPDVVVGGHIHNPSSTNYKGTSLLTTGSFISQPIFWLINLQTREIFKKDFS